MTPNVVSVIEANIDNMSGEIFGYVMDKLFEYALDVTYTPIMMKKNRPAIQVSVICSPENEQAAAACLFRETTTLGVRISRMERLVLEREFGSVETEYGSIAVKYAGGRASPEFEDMKRAALEHDVALRDVYEAAVAAIHTDKTLNRSSY